MSQYRIAPDALRELEEIIDYFSVRSIEAGDQFLDEFNKKCRYLTQFPRIGRSYQEIHLYLRGIPIKSYILFYRILDDGIEIMPSFEVSEI